MDFIHNVITIIISGLLKCKCSSVIRICNTYISVSRSTFFSVKPNIVSSFTFQLKIITINTLKRPQTVIRIRQEIHYRCQLVLTPIGQIATFIMRGRIELNIVIVTVTDNRGWVHRLESVGHGSPLISRLRLTLCINKREHSEQHDCAEQGGSMSEKLFHGLRFYLVDVVTHNCHFLYLQIVIKAYILH